MSTFDEADSKDIEDLSDDELDAAIEKIESSEKTVFTQAIRKQGVERTGDETFFKEVIEAVTKMKPDHFGTISGISSM